MFSLFKQRFDEMGENFYANWQKIVLFLCTMEYVKATGDTGLIEDLYS